MEKVVRKLFIHTNADKEEKWLNDMARNGYMLKKATLGKYTFVKTDKKFKIRLAYLPKEKLDFIRLIEDGGAQYITTGNNWGYFIKEVNSFHDNFEIYSDIDSQIEQKKRILKFLTIIYLILFSIVMITSYPILNNTFNTLIKVSYVTINLIITVIYLLMILKLFNQIKKLKQERNIHE